MAASDISVTFYNVPVIDTAHRSVIVHMRGYLPRHGGTAYTVKSFTPTYSPFTIQITNPSALQSAANDMWNYCTFTANGVDWGCFVTSVTPVTTGTWTIDLLPDWWYMFIDGDLSADTAPSSVQVTGVINKSTAWRYGEGLTPADAAYMPPQFGNVTAHSIQKRSPEAGYVLAANYLVAASTNLASFKVESCQNRNLWVIDPTVRSSALLISATAEVFAAVDHIKAGDVTYGVVSMTNMQVIPAELKPNVNTLASADKAATIYIDYGEDTQKSYDVRYMLADWYDNISVAYTTLSRESFRGSPSRVVEVGNYVKRIRLNDSPRRANLRIRTAFAGDRLRVLIQTPDGWEDMTDCTTVPFEVSDYGGVTAQHKSADALQLLSAGIALAGSVGATVATGGAAAPTLIPAALGVASPIIQQATRGHTVSMTVPDGFWRNVSDFSVIGFVIYEPANKVARATDALMRGYDGSAAFASANLIDLIRAYSSIQNPGYEWIRFADGVDVRILPKVVDGVQTRPLPPPGVMEEIAAALVQGIGFWVSMGSSWDVWADVGDFGKLYTARATAL